jgi:hypothetical protein
VILAHYTANDSSSATIVFGLAMFVLGIRGLVRSPLRRRRAVLQVIGSIALVAAGVVIGWVH